jgi:hypothetical protein
MRSVIFLQELNLLDLIVFLKNNFIAKKTCYVIKDFKNDTTQNLDISNASTDNCLLHVYYILTRITSPKNMVFRKYAGFYLIHTLHMILSLVKHQFLCVHKLGCR